MKFKHIIMSKSIIILIIMVESVFDVLLLLRLFAGVVVFVVGVPIKSALLLNFKWWPSLLSSWFRVGSIGISARRRRRWMGVRTVFDGTNG